MYDKPMLEGICPKCGTRFIGWALLNPRHQTCPRCGSGLEITEDGKMIGTGYSPFTAEKYYLDTPPNLQRSPAEEKPGKKEDSDRSSSSQRSANFKEGEKPT
ncbi:MAG TPA: hypothetical protein G4O17_03290 [Dehalococcoidia bacterium]|nr:hypothetical protein [Dehalococcoidia bacterium]